MSEFVLKPHHLERLPVFPLPNVALFPETVVPLHIFEPRYREMTTECLENNWPLAIAALEEGHEQHLARPFVHPLCGVGHIIRHEALPDGRFNILVQGLSRCRLLEELEGDRMYRIFRATTLRDRRTDQVELRAETLRACLVALGQQTTEIGDVLHRHVLPIEDVGRLTDVLTSMLITDDDVRQQLLETLDVAARVDILVSRVSELLVEFAPEDRDVH